MTGIWTAIVASLALHNWKRQSKAQKQTEFLDELTDVIHKYMDLIAAPTDMVRFIKVGVSSYSASPQLDRSLRYPEAVAYIRNQGKRDAKRLREYLEPCTPVIAKIRSLVAKGQVFGFSDYSECQNACRMIIWQYDRIRTMLGIIGCTSLNWQNPLVEDSLESVLTLDPDKMTEHIEQQYVKFIEFVRESYTVAYK